MQQAQRLSTLAILVLASSSMSAFASEMPWDGLHDGTKSEINLVPDATVTQGQPAKTPYELEEQLYATTPLLNTWGDLSTEESRRAFLDYATFQLGNDTYTRHIVDGTSSVSTGDNVYYEPSNPNAPRDHRFYATEQTKAKETVRTLPFLQLMAWDAVAANDQGDNLLPVLVTTEEMQDFFKSYAESPDLGLGESEKAEIEKLRHYDPSASLDKMSSDDGRQLFKAIQRYQAWLDPKQTSLDELRQALEKYGSRVLSYGFSKEQFAGMRSTYVLAKDQNSRVPYAAVLLRLMEFKAKNPAAYEAWRSSLDASHKHEIYAIQWTALPNLMNAHYEERFPHGKPLKPHQTMVDFKTGQLQQNSHKVRYQRLVLDHAWNSQESPLFVGGRLEMIKAKIKSDTLVPTKASSQGFSLGVYGGWHQIQDTPLFVSTELSYRQWKHKVDDKANTQKYLEATLESGLEMGVGELTFTPSVQVGARMHPGSQDVKVTTVFEKGSYKLASRTSYFVNAQVKAGYRFESAWGTFEPNLIVGYEKHFNNKLVMDKTRRFPLADVEYLAFNAPTFEGNQSLDVGSSLFNTQAGLHWTRGPVEFDAIAGLKIGRQHYRDRSLVFKAKYRF